MAIGFRVWCVNRWFLSRLDECPRLFAANEGAYQLIEEEAVVESFCSICKLQGLRPILGKADQSIQERLVLGGGVYERDASE